VQLHTIVSLQARRIIEHTSTTSDVRLEGLHTAEDIASRVSMPVFWAATNSPPGTRTDSGELRSDEDAHQRTGRHTAHQVAPDATTDHVCAPPKTPQTGWAHPPRRALDCILGWFPMFIHPRERAPAHHCYSGAETVPSHCASIGSARRCMPRELTAIESAITSDCARKHAGLPVLKGDREGRSGQHQPPLPGHLEQQLPGASSPGVSRPSGCLSRDERVLALESQVYA
jgi:hypothetical protein